MAKSLLMMDYAAVMLMICLLIFILTNNYFYKKIRNLFLVACALVLLLVTADSVEYWMATWDHLSVMRVWMSAIGYSLRPAIVFVIICLLRPRDRIVKCLAIPLVLNGVIAFSAFFTDIAYSYTPDNQFVRGSFGYFAFVTSGFYIIILFLYTFKRYGKSDLSEMYISIVVIILLVVSTVLESVAKCDGMINTTGAVTLVFYYLYLNTQQFKRDALTGAFNRRCFYLDAEKNDASLSAVLSIDLNNLKKWNDEYGHAKGDDAIRTVAGCMQKELQKGWSLYRTGGDEFMMLYCGRSREEVAFVLSAIRTAVEKTPYSCAIGVAYRRPDESFQKLCSRADQQMYENKFLMKQEK